MAGALTSASFIQWRWQYLRGYPWCVCRGDIGANLDDLVSSPRPMDDTTANIWDLMKMKFPKEDLVAAIRLMGNTSFSSEQVEQGHSFASAIMKRHREYGQESLRCRSLIASVRPMVELTEVEKKIMRLQRQLDRLQKRRPQYFTGRQFYFQQLRCLAGHLARSGRNVGSGVAKQLMKHHGASWKNLSLDQRRSLEYKASVARLGMEHDMAENKEQLQSEISSLQRGKSSVDGGEDLPILRMSSVRWSLAQLRELDQLFHSGKFASSTVAVLREKVHADIVPPSEEMQRFFEGLPGPLRGPAVPRLSWLACVCLHRDMFAHCIFKFQGESDETVVGRPTFIRQSPYVVGFVKLDVADLENAVGKRLVQLRDLKRHWNHVFAIDSRRFCFSDEGGFEESWRLHILTDSVLRDGGFVVTEAEWKPFDDIRSFFPGPNDQVVDSDRPAPNDECEQPEATQPVWAKLPWLLEHFPLHAGSSSKVHADEVTGTSAGADGDDAPVPSLISSEEVIEALYERRFHWQGEGERCPDFKVQLRGGQWTAAHTGMAYDSFRGFAMRGEASQICARFNMQSTATFAIRSFSEEGAQCLANLWCHRMQWYLDLWRVHGCAADFVFADDELRIYEEPEISVRLIGDELAAFNRRLGTIRGCRPR